MSKMIILSRKMCALQTFPAFQFPFFAISWQEMAIWAGNDIFYDPKHYQTNLPQAPFKKCSH